MAQAPKWSAVNDTYTLNIDNTSIEVIKGKGGRITHFSLDGNNILFWDGTHGGATLWPSPQSSWSYWPLPAAFETNDAASIGLTGNKETLSLTTGIDNATKTSLRKTIWGNAETKAFTIKYQLYNKNESARKYACWEVTRIPINSLTFFPKGSNYRISASNPGGPSDLGATLENDTMLWYQYAPPSGPNNNKLFRDGGREGWMAHLYHGMLFIRKFNDVDTSQFAPQESEMEVYSAPDLVEAENTGPYVSIPAKDSISWSVTWYIRKPPTGIDATIGSRQLIAYVNGVVSEADRIAVHEYRGRGPANRSIQVFPSLSGKGMATIDLSEVIGDNPVDVTITDLRGEVLVAKRNTHEARVAIEAGTISGRGIVFIHVKTNRSAFTRKLLVPNL